jgi:hypothetical protein
MKRRPDPKRFADLSAMERRRVRELSDEAASMLLQAAEDKRRGLDQMMWQVPALSLTAQSFLLTIALGDMSGCSHSSCSCSATSQSS